MTKAIGQLDEGQAGLLGELGELLDDVELALVCRAVMSKRALGRADEVGVEAESLRQRPDSQPPASGL